MTGAGDCAIKGHGVGKNGAGFPTKETRPHGMIFPQVGSWYRRLDGRLFEVVAIDEAAGTVEMQHFDGTIGEVEQEAWHQMELEAAAAPEDWSGSVDMDTDDLSELNDMTGQNWQDPFEFVDQLE